MREIQSRVLENDVVRLEPLDESHRPVLKQLVAQTGEAHWAYLTKVALGDTNNWFDWLIARHRSRKQLVYVVFDNAHNKAVGCTSFSNVEDEHDRLEIGGTWYVPSAQGTCVNPATKLLLLEYAFSDLGCHRVELKCDVLNQHSRRAILKLGAKEEGVLRGHMKVHDGKGGTRYRDTVYHAILAEEWPGVKQALKQRLIAHAEREKA